MERIFSGGKRVGVMRAAFALLVLALLAGPALAAPATTAGTQDAAIDVHLDDDGDARWTVSVRHTLDSPNETAAFRRLGDTFESEGLRGELSVALFEELADRAAERTGRDMTLENRNREAVIRNRSNRSVGVLSLRFRWTEFAPTDGQRVVVGDAFTEGLGLEADQTLRLHAPANYAIDTLQPSPTAIRSGVVSWEGARQFDAGTPSVTFVPKSAVSTTPPPTERPDDDDMMLGAALLGGLLLGAVLIVLLLGGYGLHTHGTAFGWLSRGTDGQDDGETAGGDDPGDRDHIEGGADPAATDAPETGSGDTADPGGDAGDPDEDSVVDEELLSDEERVERLLGRNGGRMKQADVVSETGWSNAKVSQLLSGMAEEDRVEKLQLGRENLISLPEYEDEET
jgi:hypothetical protein